MTKSLDEILESVANVCDRETKISKDFVIEFGTFSLHKLKATNVKCIAVSPLMNLKLVHFMNENKANVAVTLLPLSIIENEFPLSEIDFELLRSLITNNIKTIRLPHKWLYSIKGSFPYFLQTLGLNKMDYSSLVTDTDKKLTIWNLPEMSFQDFFASLSHLNKKWIAHTFGQPESKLSFVLEDEKFSSSDFQDLKEAGINTIVSFSLDSSSIPIYQKNRMNFLFIPFIDYSNIALRKFAQVLQLETNEKVLFHPFEAKEWIGYQDLEKR